MDGLFGTDAVGARLRGEVSQLRADSAEGRSGRGAGTTKRHRHLGGSGDGCRGGRGDLSGKDARGAPRNGLRRIGILPVDRRGNGLGNGRSPRGDRRNRRRRYAGAGRNAGGGWPKQSGRDEDYDGSSGSGPEMTDQNR